MKTILKQFLKYYLKSVTKLVLLIHRPLIIGVTGSINEVFTKEEIKRQLTEVGLEARSNPKNFNTEIGLPLAILNLKSGYNSYKNWLPIIWRAFEAIFNLKFPKILILGLGVSDPGDMKYLMSLVKPKIAIITDITQRYIASFSDMNKLAKEYEYFIRSMDKNGYLILNYDNQRIRNLAEFNHEQTIFFGLGDNGPKNYWQGRVIERTLNGQKILVTHSGETTDYEINRFGQHHIYALLVGLIVKKTMLSLK